MLGSRGARRSVLAAATAAALLMPMVALADDRAARSMPSSSVDSIDADARSAYDAALSLLRAGRQVDGQRQLERLIAGYPDSPYAEAARTKVVELYTAPVRAARRSGLGVSPTHIPAPGLGEGDAVSGSWQVDVRRAHVPVAADDFRTRIGDRVFFAAGSAELGSRARDVLRAQAEWLKRHPGLVVTIEGHADDPGPQDVNLDLAIRRAEAVRRRLVEEGVPAERVAGTAFGSEQRVALCLEAVCAAQNRRAVTILELRAGGAIPGGHGGVAQGVGGLPR
jgi:peptidoglycan-associated lipoprotein